ncbi:MAG: hypothetical protein GY710_09365 [Desulfobacteraceae bacterium]|nr:hypothetical protein [Desulfobacteraceae bacterium]
MTRKDQINLIGKNLSNILNTKDYEKWIHVKQHLAEQGVIVEITTENKGKYFLNRIEKIGPSTIKSESEQIPQSRWERFKDRVISPLKKDQTKTATALN